MMPFIMPNNDVIPNEKILFISKCSLTLNRFCFRYDRKITTRQKLYCSTGDSYPQFQVFIVEVFRDELNNMQHAFMFYHGFNFAFYFKCAVKPIILVQ